MLGTKNHPILLTLRRFTTEPIFEYSAFEIHGVDWDFSTRRVKLPRYKRI